MYAISYNSYMEQEKYQVLRIWKHTHRTLRKIAAFTGESLVEAIERLATEEWKRIQRKGEKSLDAAEPEDQT
jgi:hypothetical protein